MLKRTSLFRLNNEELNTLVTRLLAAVEKIGAFKTGIIATIIAAVVKYNQQLTKSLNTSLKSSYSDTLKSLDEMRDNAFKALRDSVLGASNRLNENFSANAKQLLVIFKNHGWSLWSENYQVETSKLRSLFTDLDQKEMSNALTTINLMDWYIELKTAQSNFENAFQNKASSDLRDDYVSMQKIKPDLIKSTNEMLDQIEMLIKYSDKSSENDDLVDTINNVIEETAILAKSRQTRNNIEEVLD